MIESGVSLGGMSAAPHDRPPFKPPFCPWPECAFHDSVDIATWRCHRRGARRVQRSARPNLRFRCLSCGRSFCQSAFDGTYWSKRPEVVARVYRPLCEGQALRQIARTLRYSLTTVRRAQRWLARQALLRHLEVLRRLAGNVREPAALDGARAITGSTFEMVEINTLVLVHSGLVLDLTPFGIRRTGRMSASQRRERRRREARLGRPHPRARSRAAHRSLEQLAALVPPNQVLEIRTDEDPAYRPALRAVRRRVHHVTVSSRARRDESNPLWQLNHKHRLLRHMLACLKRQTIAQCKTLAGLSDRLLVARLWLNATKGVSERSAPRSRLTPLMKLGLAERPLTGRDLLAVRRFPRRERLPEEWRVVYEGRVTGRPHELVRPYVHNAAA